MDTGVRAPVREGNPGESRESSVGIQTRLSACRHPIGGVVGRKNTRKPLCRNGLVIFVGTVGTDFHMKESKRVRE